MMSRYVRRREWWRFVGQSLGFLVAAVIALGLALVIAYAGAAWT